MPKTETVYHSTKPFSADIIIRQEGHTVHNIKEDGYKGTSVNIDGGMLLNIKLSADNLPALIKKIEGHVALVE